MVVDVIVMVRMITRMAGDASANPPKPAAVENVAVTADVVAIATSMRHMVMPGAVVVRVEPRTTNRSPGFGARRCGSR